ncbi:MAG: exodeoxyribonuclease VII small subunit [Tepidisphaeraceae bacterium]
MAKRPAQVPPKSFEEAVSELEQILHDLESDRVGLEQSLSKYERGTFLLTWCRGVLGDAEKRIEQLTQNADGKLTARPMSPQPDVSVDVDPDDDDDA